MFGISWAELLVVILVAVLVIPAQHWPDVAKFLARVVKFIRNLILKITDATTNIKEQIELEKPINDLIKSTTDEVLSSFSSKRPIVDSGGRGVQKTPQKKNKKSMGVKS